MYMYFHLYKRSPILTSISERGSNLVSTMSSCILSLIFVSVFRLQILDSLECAWSKFLCRKSFVEWHIFAELAQPVSSRACTGEPQIVETDMCFADTTQKLSSEPGEEINEGNARSLSECRVRAALISKGNSRSVPDLLFDCKTESIDK